MTSSFYCLYGYSTLITTCAMQYIIVGFPLQAGVIMNFVTANCFPAIYTKSGVLQNNLIGRLSRLIIGNVYMKMYGSGIGPDTKIS